jgi:hypothetical protein
VDEVLVNREIKLLARAGTPIMLKPLLITTATLFSAAFISFDTAQAANAATQSHPVQNGHQELIARGNKSSHLSAQKQSDIKSIHAVLTKAYRAFNNQDIEALQRLELKPSSSEKLYLRQLFSRLKAMNADASYEVKSIDLIRLTGHTAVVKISQSTIVVGGANVNALQDTTLALVKYQGKWKVSDGEAVIKSISKNR